MIKEIVVKEKNLAELYEAYLDCLDLAKRKDLTDYGKGELEILRFLFE
jgi:predicted ester cyclase